MHEVKILASVIAVGIGLVMYVPYVRDMLRGTNKPHLYTWVCSLLVISVVAYLQIVGGAGVGAIPAIVSVVVNTVLVFYCFRFGTKDIVVMDKVCLVLTCLGVVTYLILHSYPMFALVILTIAEIIAFIPTVRKTRNDPYSESLPSYYLLVIKVSFILLALEQYNWLTTSYSVTWQVLIVAFLIATHRWRAQWHGKRTTHPEGAPPLI